MANVPSPMPVHRSGVTSMDQMQPPIPPTQPRHDLPRYLERQAQQYATHYEPEPRKLADILYELMWPVGSWCVILFNVAVMITTLLGMITQYHGWNHAQVTGISVLAFGALAAIHKYAIAAQPKPAEPMLGPNSTG